MQQTEHTTSSAQLLSSHTPDARLSGLMSPDLKTTRENQKQGKSEDVNVSGLWRALYLSAASLLPQIGKGGPCYHKLCNQRGPRHKLHRWWQVWSSVHTSHFVEKKPLNPKHMMPWNQYVGMKNKYADMKNDPGGRWWRQEHSIDPKTAAQGLKMSMHRQKGWDMKSCSKILKPDHSKRWPELPALCSWG